RGDLLLLDAGLRLDELPVDLGLCFREAAIPLRFVLRAELGFERGLVLQGLRLGLAGGATLPPFEQRHRTAPSIRCDGAAAPGIRLSVPVISVHLRTNTLDCCGCTHRKAAIARPDRGERADEVPSPGVSGRDVSRGLGSGTGEP